MKNIAIIGGGPAGLMAAEIASKAGHTVTVYDRMPTLGRKFLMAGRGGLNLTHSEPLEKFLTRYGNAQAHMTPYISAYTPADLMAWCEKLGQEIFTGTSGRVFPKAFKASPLLRAWLQRLSDSKVTFMLEHSWTGWTAEGFLTFSKPDGATLSIKPDATLLALGGASWPKLGSNAHWINFFPPEIPITPFMPSNCGLVLNWSEIFKEKFSGHPLKSISLSYGDKTIPGELMVTATGLEGTPAYTLSPQVRDTLHDNKKPEITLDLRPNLPLEDITNKLRSPRKRQSLSTFLQKTLHLSPAAIGLVQEIVHQKKIPDTPQDIATLIKALPLSVTGVSSLERAISSAGGIAFNNLTPDLMIKNMPGVFVAGEMLDWEAPTGGYLLQGCFSTAVAAANGLNRYLK